MANYSLVANSTFQPFSYQELIAPIDRQNAYHEKLMDEYDKLSSQADVLEAMGANDRDKDSKVYQQYKNYSDRLRAEADNLYRNGLNTESRMRLSELRRMYNTDIVPIQNAWQKREKEAELQMKAQLDASSKGIDLYFSRNAADTPLQSYLDNPNQTFRTINGQALMNEVAAQFKAMANQVQVDKNGNPWIGKQQLSPIEYSIITQKGMDYNQYMDFINNPNDPRFANIRGIINGTLTAHGAQDFDPTTQQRLFGLASQGVAAGVGSRDMQFHTDPYAQDMLNYNQQVELENLKHQNEMAKARANGDDVVVLSTGVGLKTEDAYRTDGLEALSNLKGGKDGLKASIFGNTVGKVNPMQIYKEYQQELAKTHKIVGAGAYARDTANPQKAKETVLKKYAKYGVTDILTKDQYDMLSGMGYDENHNFNGRYSDIENRFDNLVISRSRYSVNMSQYNVPDQNIKSNLNTSNRTDLVWELKKDGQRGSMISDYGKLKLKDSTNSKGNSVTNIEYDPDFPEEIVVTLSGGEKPGKYIMDPSVLGGDTYKNAIRYMVQRGATPERITKELKFMLNSYNKTKSLSEKED